jgi:hypothetical protein
MKKDEVAIRKRTQIAKANRTMFLWIAGASALVGAAIVVSIFLGQKLIYGEKVIAAKQETVDSLAYNNSIIPQLEDDIRVLDTNKDLASVKANQNDQALQVILDALPSDANSLALGASLQSKLLTGIDGLNLDSLQVDPVVGVETLTGDDAGSGDSSSGDFSTIAFRFTVTGTDQQIKAVLQNLERSIRTITVTSVNMEIQGGRLILTAQAQAYYEPARSIELRKEPVQP